MLNQDGLSAAARPNHNCCLALLYGKVNPVENNILAELLGKIAKNNYAVFSANLFIIIFIGLFHYSLIPMHNNVPR